MCCDRIHIPYNVAGITSLGDDNAIVLPKMFSPLYSSGPHFLSQFCNENRCYQKCSQKSQKRSIGKKRILSKTDFFNLFCKKSQELHHLKGCLCDKTEAEVQATVLQGNISCQMSFKAIDSFAATSVVLIVRARQSHLVKLYSINHCKKDIVTRAMSSLHRRRNQPSKLSYLPTLHLIVS